MQKRRKDAGLTQKELAERSGVKLRTIQQYEMSAQNINKVAAEPLLQLAKTLFLYRRFAGIRLLKQKNPGVV